MILLPRVNGHLVVSLGILRKVVGGGLFSLSWEERGRRKREGNWMKAARDRQVRFVPPLFKNERESKKKKLRCAFTFL